MSSSQSPAWSMWGPSTLQSFRACRLWRQCVPRDLRQLVTRPLSARQRREKPVTAILAASTTQRAGKWTERPALNSALDL